MSGTSISLLATGVVGLLNIVFTIPAVLYLDKVGRRPSLIFGAIGLSAVMIIQAILVAAMENGWMDNRVTGVFAIAMVYLFIGNIVFIQRALCHNSYTAHSHSQQSLLVRGDL
jgi:MFS family permease